jgi:hypothetical protein
MGGSCPAAIDCVDCDGRREVAIKDENPTSIDSRVEGACSTMYPVVDPV